MSDNERLEDALARIAQLETVFAAMQEKQTAAQFQIDTIGNALLKFSRRTGNNIRELAEYIWPVLHKLFPRTSETRVKFDAIMQKYGAPPTDDDLNDKYLDN